MKLTWQICDPFGVKQADIGQRSNASVHIAVNDQRTATVTVSLEEFWPRHIHPGRSRIKTFCHPENADDPPSYLLHNGIIVEPEATGATAELPSVDQSVRLLNASHAPYPNQGTGEVPSEWDVANFERSEAMWELIVRANKRYRQLNDDATFRHHKDYKKFQDLGIKKGTLADSKDLRDWKFADGKTTWDALTDMAEGNKAPDFELNPLDRDDGTHAEFNTFFPHQGDKKLDVVLELGHNVDLDGFSYKPTAADLCNRYALTGQPEENVAPVWVAENWYSIRRYGIWQRDATSDTSDLEKLKAEAEEYVAIHDTRVPMVEFTPDIDIGGTAFSFARDALGNLVPQPKDEYSQPPVFGPPGIGDYWLGDTITFRAPGQFHIEFPRLAGADADFPLRIMEAEFQEVDEHGNVAISMVAAPITRKAGVKGYSSKISVAGF